MAEGDSGKAAWTVKSVDTGIRKLATASAAKTGETMAEWLSRAVTNQASLEAGTRILPPSPTPSPGTSQGRALTPSPAASAPLVPVDMTALSGLLQAVQGMAQASGVTIPRSTAKHALLLARDQLRAARGLPVLPGRSPKPKSGQTVSGEQEE